MVTSASQPSYFRLVPGDVNGFLGLVVDNLSVLGLLAAVLIGGYGVPADIVFGKMFPGTALGVLVGDLAYTWLAVRLARRTSRRDVTAMPFGLDTPSTIGMALLVLGPAFAQFRAAGLDPTSAGLQKLKARAEILEPEHPFFLADRVVPRAGVLVDRYFRRTRSPDGSTFVWMARKSGVGKGPGWSGLRFDIVRNMTQPPG